MADIDFEKSGVIAALAVSLLNVWRSIASNGERSKKKADERTVEMLRIHVQPQLDEIKRTTQETQLMVRDMIPQLVGNVVKQTVDASTRQVFETAKELLKIKAWEDK